MIFIGERINAGFKDIRAAIEAGKSAGAERIVTSHVPPCLMQDLTGHYRTIDELELMIVAPGNSFRGEESPFECGRKIRVCEGCLLWDRCFGIREDYLRVHGESEFSAIKRD